MKLFRLCAVFTILLCTPSLVPSFAEDDDDDEHVAYCGSPPENMRISIATPMRPPGQKLPDADRSTYKPFQILYVTIGELSPGDDDLLKHASARINSRLAETVRGPRLGEIRFRKEYHKKSGTCDKPRCGSISVTRDYAAPCRNENGDPVGRDNPKPEIQAMNERQEFSMVAFVFSPSQNNVTMPDECKNKQTLAFASPCQVGDRYRPTHGQLVICRPLKDMGDEDAIRDVLFHESLHIVTGSTLDGSYFPVNPAIQAFHEGITKRNQLIQSAMGLTWKYVTRNWEIDDSFSSQKPMNVAVTITPKVVEFLKDHFRCDSVEGAELAVHVSSPNGSNVNRAHWSIRLFPEELLTPLSSSLLVFSKLTLAYLQDSTWYDVNMSLADPLTVSRPRPEQGCNVAKNSCFAVLKPQAAHQQKVQKTRPFCDKKGRVITPLCSSDNRARLRCEFPSKDDITFGCYVQRGDPNKYYNHVMCDLATSLNESLLQRGLSFGNGTMCITFVNTSWISKKSLASACVAYMCGDRQLNLSFLRGNKPSCDVVIQAGVHDNTIIKDPFLADDECSKFLPSVKFIAPEVKTMCPWSDPLNDGAFRHYAFDIWQHVIVCALCMVRLVLV